MTAFPLTAAQRATVDQFLKLGQQLDKDAAAVLHEAEKVKKIFSKKPRGTAIDGCHTFDEFIDKCFPVSSSTVRRLLRKEGKTDKRFANKTKPAAEPPLPVIPEKQESEEVVTELAASQAAKQVITHAFTLRDQMSDKEWQKAVELTLNALESEYKRLLGSGKAA